jgi:hypothetical protein
MSQKQSDIFHFVQLFANSYNSHKALQELIQKSRIPPHPEFLVGLANSALTLLANTKFNTNLSEEDKKDAIETHSLEPKYTAPTEIEKIDLRMRKDKIAMNTKTSELVTFLEKTINKTMENDKELAKRVYARDQASIQKKREQKSKLKRKNRDSLSDAFKSIDLNTKKNITSRLKKEQKGGDSDSDSDGGSDGDSDGELFARLIMLKSPSVPKRDSDGNIVMNVVRSNN